jgi:hypothetical protein
MKTYLYRLLLGLLQKQCKHPGGHVSADILEGDVHGHIVSQCRICGAVNRTPDYTNWQPIRADFWKSDK